MLTSSDMHYIADCLDKASVRFRLAADNIFPTGMDRELAMAMLGRVQKIIKIKEELECRERLETSEEKSNDDEGRLGGEDMAGRREGVPSLPAASRGAA